MLGRGIDRIKSVGVLLIMTYRPEFEPPWIGRPYVTTLTLNRLGEREIAAMIDRVAGNRALVRKIRQDIIERTDGIPLFAEEMTKAVLEAESQEAGERAAGAIPAASATIPASLHASLMARLDRLGSAKAIAQIGAAIGREFSHPILAAVVDKPDAELRSALDKLISAGLLFRQGPPLHTSYLFKHALVQDAAYGTMLREQRRTLHARVAETIESSFTDIAEHRPELLARHCTEAGLMEKSAGLWGKAGERSLAHSALAEAVEQFTRALNQIATLPATRALCREQIKFQVGLVNALMHTKGYAAPETKAALEQARSLIQRADSLGESPEDPLLLFFPLYGLWAMNFLAFNGEIVCELATQFLALAEKQAATVPLMIGHRLMGTSLLFTGRLIEGQEHLDQAITLYDRTQHRPLATKFGQDVHVAALSYRSWALWMLGYPDAALAATSSALKDAREIDQVAALMFALSLTSFPDIVCGSYVKAMAQIDELVALADEKGAVLWKALGMALQGCVLALTGDASRAVQLITSGRAAYRSTGGVMTLPWFLPTLAKAHAELGQFDAAWGWIGETMTTVEATKERWCEAEVHRIAGEIALMSPERDAAKAEGYFERALAVARQQQAKSWELRAAMSLARLWRDQGKPQQARELLASVYGWFTEGFDTRDLKEAKALLEELAS